MIRLKWPLKVHVDYDKPNSDIIGHHQRKEIHRVLRATVLGSPDHDVKSKGSFTPSICLEVDFLQYGKVPDMETVS